eukprot:3382982-Alexandrium_andersonii.AAC.1
MLDATPAATAWRSPCPNQTQQVLLQLVAARMLQAEAQRLAAGGPAKRQACETVWGGLRGPGGSPGS